uniref:Uncharacterized protein n=1 Tax=Heterorhabditis bacteriophora TaxID=37862 RepID=A0A1I7XTN5_HETBA
MYLNPATQVNLSRTCEKVLTISNECTRTINYLIIFKVVS